MPSSLFGDYASLMSNVASSIPPLKCLLPSTLAETRATSKACYSVVVDSQEDSHPHTAQEFSVSDSGGEQQAYSQALKWGVDTAHERFCKNGFVPSYANLAFSDDTDGGASHFVAMIADYSIAKMTAAVIDLKSGRPINSHEFRTGTATVSSPYRDANAWVMQHLRTAENISGSTENLKGEIVCWFTSGEQRILPLNPTQT